MCVCVCVCVCACVCETLYTSFFWHLPPFRNTLKWILTENTSELRTKQTYKQKVRILEDLFKKNEQIFLK